MAFSYLECSDDNARTNFSFDMTGGSAKAFYHLFMQIFNSDLRADVQALIQDIIGYTNPQSGTQYLQRLIPRTHPRYPYLYASKISSLIGQGTNKAVQIQPVNPAVIQIGNRPIANYLQYLLYEIGIDFTSRQYPIIADSSFQQTLSSSWYAKDGSAQTFTYAPEWVRYCDYDFFPQDNTIQGQQGNMFLVGTPGGEVPFTSPPWFWLPDQILKVTWYQVPYSYITSPNSYIASNPLRTWRGRINQNDWWNWPAGSLLYLGYTVKKYTPPTNDITIIPETLASPQLIQYSRLCDIELNFLLTSRFNSGLLGGVINNKNFVAAGHNLLPSLADCNFYYSTRSADGSFSLQNAPAWLSCPFEAFFTNPDAPGGPVTTGDQ